MRRTVLQMSSILSSLQAGFLGSYRGEGSPSQVICAYECFYAGTCLVPGRRAEGSMAEANVMGHIQNSAPEAGTLARLGAQLGTEALEHPACTCIPVFCSSDSSQLLSLCFAQLNIKAGKHFGSSAQRCQPNYPPAGLSYCASCIPGCWQSLAHTPVIASRKAPALQPSLPALVCSFSVPWGYLCEILGCPHLFKTATKSCLSS